jgi:hypothetical protein
MLLALRWKNQADEVAMHKLARAYAAQIALAVRFRHYGLSLADPDQEGHVGSLRPPRVVRTGPRRALFRPMRRGGSRLYAKLCFA